VNAYGVKQDGSFHSRINVWVTGKTVWSRRAIPERIRCGLRRCAIQIDVYFTSSNVIKSKLNCPEIETDRHTHRPTALPGSLMWSVKSELGFAINYTTTLPILYRSDLCNRCDLFSSNVVARLVLGQIDAVYCYRRSSVVSVCVCWSRQDPYKNGWTGRDAVWGLTRAGPVNHVLDGVEIPHGKGQFLGAAGLLKSTVGQ